MSHCRCRSAVAPGHLVIRCVVGSPLERVRRVLDEGSRDEGFDPLVGCHTFFAGHQVEVVDPVCAVQVNDERS